MPIHGALDPESQLFRTRVEGTVTLGEIVRHLRLARETGAHEHPGLVDARDVSHVAFRASDLMRIAHQARELLADPSPAPRAVVVDDLSHFGLARLFSSLVAGWLRVGVFEDAESAEAWLRRHADGMTRH